MAMIAPHVAVLSKSEILPRQYQFTFNLAFMLSSFMLLSSRALGVMVSQFENDSIVPDTSYMALFVSLTPLSNHMAEIDKRAASGLHHQVACTLGVRVGGLGHGLRLA
jgi:hypothetical protein